MASELKEEGREGGGKGRREKGRKRKEKVFLEIPEWLSEWERLMRI